MNEDQLKVLTQRLDQIQKVVNRIDEDLAADRRDLQETTLRLGAVEGIIDQLKSDLTRLPSRVADKVDDTMKPATAEIKDLKETIEHKKELILNIIKKPFWKIW